MRGSSLFTSTAVPSKMHGGPVESAIIAIVKAPISSTSDPSTLPVEGTILATAEGAILATAEALFDSITLTLDAPDGNQVLRTLRLESVLVKGWALDNFRRRRARESLPAS